jgi:hypothetical protein
MVFVFPAAPEIGDAYASGGASYFWNGIIWERGVGLVKPFLTQLIPNEGPTNAATAVRVLGGNFKADSEVRWDGVAVATTFVTTSELTCTAPSEPLAKIVSVDVMQDAGLMISGPLEFTYIQPGPIITALEPNVSPTNVVTRVKIKGSNFTTNSKVVFDAVLLTPTFVNAGELQVDAPVRTAAKAVVVVVQDGVLNSNQMPFNYLLQTMWLHQVTPNNVDNMAGQTRIDFIGEGFKAHHQFIFGNVAMGTITFVSSTSMWTWMFPSTWNMGSPATPGTVNCYAFDAQTGETSNVLPFTFT